MYVTRQKLKKKKERKDTWLEEGPREGEKKGPGDQKTNEWRMNAGTRPRGNQGECFIVIRAMWDETERRLVDGGKGGRAGSSWDAMTLARSSILLAIASRSRHHVAPSRHVRVASRALLYR